MNVREVQSLRARLSAHAGRRHLSLATTANINNPPLFVGSDRCVGDMLAGNIILRSSSFLPELIAYLDAVVDCYFVDSETKGGICLRTEAAALIEPGRLHFMKPNDFTVEALDEWLSQKDARLHDRGVTVIGAGNIGGKIALRLAERGCHVRLASRNHERCDALCRGLGALLQGGGRLEAVASPVEACRNADILLSCTPGIPALDQDAIRGVSAGCLLMDVGNGSFSKEAMEEAHRRGLRVEVLSAAAGWEGYLARMTATRSLQQAMGRRMLDEGQWIVSRGILGQAGDALVDNIASPTRVIGICNGSGDLIYGDEAMQRRQRTESLLGIN